MALGLNSLGRLYSLITYELMNFWTVTFPDADLPCGQITWCLNALRATIFRQTLVAGRNTHQNMNVIIPLVRNNPEEGLRLEMSFHVSMSFRECCLICWVTPVLCVLFRITNYVHKFNSQIHHFMIDNMKQSKKNIRILPLILTLVTWLHWSQTAQLYSFFPTYFLVGNTPFHCSKFDWWYLMQLVTRTVGHNVLVGLCLIHNKGKDAR